MKKIVVKSGLIIFVLATGLFAFGPGEKYFEIAKNLDIFATLFQEVNKYYVDEVSPSELMKNGIDAMLNQLDPYTSYIPEDRIEDYRTMTTGEYGGIGAVIGKRNGRYAVIMPSEGYPAQKAGLQIGDQILKIGDVEITDRTLNEISRLLKGQVNTDVELTVQKVGETQPIKLMLKRDKIKLDNVPYYGMVTTDVGLIQLTDFTQNASKEVKNALLELKEKGATKIILDLRGNPGGLLSEAINISNIFVNKGEEIVSTKGKIESWNRSHKALNATTDTDIPMAVLINNNSASASEIVSGVMQDYDRGILVGRRTFGKGLVQATRDLSYNAKLKVTVAKYYIPSGRCIQEIDYSLSHDENGRPQKIADSLRVAFKTRNGRTVYDGGGVAPDIEVPTTNLAPITESLIRKGLLFEYGIIYRRSHAQIANAKSFALNDADFDALATWLGDKDYDYQTSTEIAFAKLVESTKKEEQYQEVAESIRTLEKQISHDKKKDLYRFKKEIMEELEKEIIAHYYWQKGQMEATFDDDPDIQAAISVLGDATRYKSLLKGN